MREDARVRIVEAATRCEEAMRLEAEALDAGRYGEASKQVDLAAVDARIAFLNARLAVSA